MWGATILFTRQFPIYQKKKFSLEEMAKDLGVSKYVLSRLFSKTFQHSIETLINILTMQG